jgi:hypothetical protein
VAARQFEQKLDPSASGRSKSNSERRRNTPHRPNARNRDRATARAQMAAVESEPDWDQHKDAVASLLAEDSAQQQTSGSFKIRTIREALLLARNQYLAADDADKRKRWMDEANAAPKSTAVTRPGVETTFKAGAQRSTADLAREQAARLERGTRTRGTVDGDHRRVLLATREAKVQEDNDRLFITVICKASRLGPPLPQGQLCPVVLGRLLLTQGCFGCSPLASASINPFS